MKPAHTRTKPLKGPSARNAQIAPSMAILKERPTTCDMALPSILVTGLCATQLAPHPSVEAARADSQELPSIHHRSESLQRNFASAGDSPGLVVPKFQANKTYCLFL